MNNTLVDEQYNDKCIKLQENETKIDNNIDKSIITPSQLKQDLITISISKSVFFKTCKVVAIIVATTASYFAVKHVKDWHYRQCTRSYNEGWNVGRMGWTQGGRIDFKSMK